LTDTELAAVHDRLADGAEWATAATEFRQLRYFVTVADELHFGRAAAQLYISQPALSQAIAKLEAAIGVKLLIRNRQGVELTEPGRALLARARAILDARDDAVNHVRLIEQGEVGVLRLGVAYFAEHAVTPALSALSARHPGMVVDRVVGVTDRLLDALTCGMVDAVLAHAMPSILQVDSVESELVITEPLAALVCPESHLASRSSLTIADLRDEPLMIPPKELAPSARVGMIMMCRSFGGFEPKLYESAAMGTQPFGADLAGNAVIFVGVSQVEAGVPDGLVAVPIEPPPLLSVALVWRRGERSPLVDRMIRLMRERREEAVS
jgi:DNA-binding transcriptional LysR family regulator